MKKLFLIMSIVSLFAYPLWSFDCSRIIKNSDSSRNNFFLMIFLSQDLTDQICIVTALGQRADPYVEEFIFGIMDHMNGRDIDRLEYLLRILLDSVFNNTFEVDELGSRVVINIRGITHLINNLHTFKDPMLKCRIMEIIPYVHDAAAISPFMTEGETLVSILKKTGGKPGSLVNGELMCFLDLIKIMGNADYFFLCQSIIELSQNRDVVKAARETIKAILAREDK